VIVEASTASALPSGWSDVDVGMVGAPGSASFDGGTYTVNGSGADVWGTADALNFAFTSVTGDFEFSGQVATVQNVSPWTKAGLMMREGTGAGARHAFVLQTPTATKGVAFQRRPAAGDASVSTGGPATAPPVWLRLVRAGNVVTASFRINTSDAWAPIGSETFDSLAATVQVGLAVSSHVANTLAMATFDTVALSAATGAAPAWSSVDVGAVSAAGSAAFDGSTFTVRGDGADIWGAADAFHFVYQPQTDAEESDFEIVAHVASVENVDAWTKAGVMVRATTEAGAAHASLFVTPTTAKGVAFQRRKADGQTSLSTAGPGITSPVWLKLVVSPNGVSAYYRTGTTIAWTFVGEEAIDFQSGASTIDAGLAVSSHASGTLATATFDNVSVRALHAWSDRDIGSVALAGSGRDDCRVQSEPPCGAVLTLAGSGADIWGASDAFHFRFTDGAQNGVSARVLSVTNTNAWAKAGVMIRDDLTPGARHVTVVVTPGKGIAMQYRAAAGRASAQVVDIPGVAPTWLRLTRTGSTFVGQVSDDGITWQEIGRVTVDMQPLAIGGLVIASHDNTKLATATFDDYYPLTR
jgi:regulation of enolase protein 1 (concanavalin A-like superfamily)